MWKELRCQPPEQSSPHFEASRRDSMMLVLAEMSLSTVFGSVQNARQVMNLQVLLSRGLSIPYFQARDNLVV